MTILSARWLVVPLVLVALVGCGAAPAGPQADLRVVIVASATTTEPAPALPSALLDELRSVAGQAVAPGDRIGASATVMTADGTTQEQLALTPRRANGEVEHGLRRPSLIEQNLAAVDAAVRVLRAQHDGLDLLDGIARAVRGGDGGLLIVLSHGLSTAGGVDLRQVGWHDDAARLTADLRERGLLARLAGWRVIFVGLGSTAAAQPALSLPVRAVLSSYWTAVCAGAGADSCAVDDHPVATGPPTGGAPMPLVPVPPVWSEVGPNGETTSTITNPLLGFDGNSSVVSAAGITSLGTVAADIRAKVAQQPVTLVAVHGYTADPPGTTPEGAAVLGQERSDAVTAVLVAAGVPQERIRSLGGGVAPGTTSLVDGQFIEARAALMRRVEITY